MSLKKFSLHKISSTTLFGFDPILYSRFKFGDDAVAESYGQALAAAFIQAHLEGNNDIGQLVIISSPYSFIPTATFAMKNYFVYELNKWLADNELPVVHETKIHRTITYKEDYGALSAEQRIKLIGNDSFHIDKEFLDGKTLVFLDDIRITGSHEKMITKMIAEFGLHNKAYLLYFAELVNAEVHPNVENYLNYYAVKSVFDLYNIVNSSRFAINTRIVKFILNVDRETFEKNINGYNFIFLNLLYNMALGNGYHAIDAYSGNLSILRRKLDSSATFYINKQEALN